MAERIKEEESKISLRLLIDTKAKKVVFAEAGKEFVDFLLHFLSLPIGTVVKLLDMGGCLGDFSNSIEALGNEFMQCGLTTASVLKPVVLTGTTVDIPLFHDASSFTPFKKLYRCPNNCGNCPWFVYEYLSDVLGAVCPRCKKEMKHELAFISETDEAPRGYVKGGPMANYMVMDNLEVKPMSAIYGVSLIDQANVPCLVEKQVQIGLTEGVALLKASLQTNAVLTTVFL